MGSNYSPVQDIIIKNFRNIGDATLSFKDSPIITLLGENESGKTSVMKAFSMCALHDSPRDQKGYIRDGTNMLGVAIRLADGTEIVRVKQEAGRNSYKVTDSTGKVWETNKITDGLPAEVQKHMGLITEPETGEYLNVRTYENNLLFVTTQSSVNYKVLYSALKVDQLTKAIKIGTQEINGLKQEISRNDASVSTLCTQLANIHVYDTTALVDIRNRISKQLELLDKIDKVDKLIEQLNAINSQLGALALLDIYKLEPISESLMSKINNASRLLNSKAEIDDKLSRYADIMSLQEIDLNPYNILLRIQGYEDQLNEKKRQAAILQPISELSEISQAEIDAISKIDSIIAKQAKIESNDKEISQAHSYIEQIEKYLIQCGVAFETCPRCGEDVLIDLDKLEELERANQPKPGDT